MDDKDKPDRKDTKEPTNEKTDDTKDVKLNNATNQNDAGPSGSISLPGAIPEKITINLQLKPGLSKSEHSIRNIITSKDVANALRSLNISANSPVIKANIKELKIPILDNDEEKEADPATFVDLKKFMASCFKINKETHSGIILGDIQNVQAVPVITSDIIHEVPNTSCNDPDKGNEVVVTGAEQKVSKVEPDKKRTSGTLSERSTERDFPVAQRDSLSSIGSNVCRICMTRGRERSGYSLLFSLLEH